MPVPFTEHAGTSVLSNWQWRTNAVAGSQCVSIVQILKEGGLLL